MHWQMIDHFVVVFIDDKISHFNDKIIIHWSLYIDLVIDNTTTKWSILCQCIMIFLCQCRFTFKSKFGLLEGICSFLIIFSWLIRIYDKKKYNIVVDIGLFNCCRCSKSDTHLRHYTENWNRSEFACKVISYHILTFWTEVVRSVLVFQFENLNFIWLIFLWGTHPIYYSYARPVPDHSWVLE